MTSPSTSEDNLVWIDMEMSGLNAQTDEVLEVAVIVTDSELNILAEGPNLVIGHPAKLFDSMDEWNQKHHVQSGLWEKVVRSEVSVEQAEKAILDFLKPYTLERKNPLCGNSIAQDRMFIIRHMPKLDAYLHYRMIDVSSIKELTRRWYPNSQAQLAKKNMHRALDDIRESIEELKFYRSHFFTASDRSSSSSS